MMKKKTEIDIKDVSQELKKFSMPCFSCLYVHSCPYYDDNIWDNWIMVNKICPVGMWKDYREVVSE